MNDTENEVAGDVMESGNEADTEADADGDTEGEAETEGDTDADAEGDTEVEASKTTGSDKESEPEQEPEPDIGDVFLNDVFKLRFHDPNDENWTMESYASLTDIGSVRDFWMAHHAIKDRYKQGIFFLMRESIFPCWDAPENIEGGCLSIKVLKENVVDYMESLCIGLLGETLLKKEYEHDWALVNGISTSPKKFFCIIKIWCSSNKYNDKAYFNIPDNFYGEVIYRENRTNIEHNQSHEIKKA